MSDTTNNPEQQSRISSWISQMTNRALSWWQYVSKGVWNDTRDNWRVNITKTLNLTIKSFFDSDLQSQASALTYQTVLAIVPALALVFAICRGFGFQNMLQAQLYELFPAQHKAIEMALSFVDSYLSQASEGIFVGVGILFLLWTLISLLGSVEDSFNKIWCVREGRTIWRKITDYLAIFLVLPVLMICAGGITIVMSTALKKIIFFDFMGPMVNLMIDALGILLTWLFFAGAYMLIPNAKVKFVNAFVAGAIVGSAFQIIQWLFLTGQMYVTKYNAIYGSFSFLPLMLIWLQLSWLTTLTGALVCYASQNIGQFSFYDCVENISISYRRRVTLAVMTLIVKRFSIGLKPFTIVEIAKEYSLPERLVKAVTLRLHEVGLVAFEQVEEEFGYHPILPAVDISKITVGDTIKRLEKFGESDFIPDFDENYNAINILAEGVEKSLTETDGSVLLSSLDINIPDAKSK